ncbi:MAG: OmpA family protein [Thiofilum sp.]|uniref:OmpA family protein n=1 Tax=Thiofilum sp. TaxID=2212733 RepID=UPI0025D059D2|nr:OmpA family protein [Thiofilum sp.]MBK8455194.1 OmpA family protein [Thiofilum sp.]
MKLKSSIILVLAALWGLGSWWWYTCKIKGFCSMTANTTAVTLATAPVADKPKAPSEDETQDNDKDGIRNGDEKRLGTDPNNPDSDEDGVPDLVEISQIPNDTDGDGLIDALDDDDDNDGILTKDESPDRNNDGRVDDALDSDNNGVPDYLQANSSVAQEQPTESEPTALKTPETSQASTPAPVAETPVVTAVVDDGSVDIFRPEPQAAAMTAEEEKRLNKGTPSPAPVVPAAPDLPSDSTQTSNADTTDTPDEANGESEIKPVQRINDTTAPVVATPPKANSDTEVTPSTTSKNADSDSAKAVNEADTKNAEKPSKATTTASIEANPKEAEQPKQAAKAEPEPQDPEGKDRNKMVVYQKGKSTEDRLGPARLNFPTGVARPTLSDETADYFDTVAAYLQKHKRATIKITGHTDNRGDADLNKTLALKRAEIVRDALIRRGAPEKQLQVSSMGESKPIASNNTVEGRQQNRRVEIMPLK